MSTTGTAAIAARGAVLLLTLVLCCIVGLVTPYLLVAIGLGVTVTLLARGTLLQLSDGLAARLFAAVFVVLAICFALSARSPHDLIYALNFVMLLLFAPLRGLLQGGAGPANATRVARMALAGTAVALCVVGFDLLVLGDPRGQSPLLGAILLANTAVLLGFLSLLGTIAPQSRYRWVYLAGPILGIITALLTGSRGPLLAVLPLALVSLLFISRFAGISYRRIAVVALVAVVAVVVLAVVIQGRGFTVFGIIANIVTGHSVTDETADIRLALYRAGWTAFLHSPLFGNGWANLMSSVRPLLPPGQPDYAALPQLHNDLLNFAVSAGIAGVLSYFLLLATPAIAAHRSPPDLQHRARLFGAALLGVAYLFDGATDLMIGFEFHTALFACLAAILLGYCRDQPIVPAPRRGMAI